MKTKPLINKNIFTTLLFLIIFLLGISIFQDYGISFDEKFHRDNGSFWYKYSKSFLFEPDSSNVHNSNNLIKQKIKEDDFLINVPSIQPVPLIMVSEFFIELFNIKDSKNVYQFKHFFNFLIFFIALCFFYKLISKRFHSYFYPITGVIFLYLTPRFFAESFYNQKDIFFLSMVIINMYVGNNFLKNPNLKTTFLFSLSSAITIDTRIMGIIPVGIALFLFFIKTLRSKKFFKNKYIFVIYFIPLTFFFIIIFWPYLWEHPLNNLIFAITNLLSANFPSSNLYAGEYILSSNIPWHYHLVWIAITTPIIIILLFLIGIFFFLKRFFTRIINLDDDLNDIWRGEREMFDIYFFLMLFLPLILYIKKGMGYDGWRHLYFVYPSIIMISLYGFYCLKLSIKKKIISNVIYTLILLNFTYISYWNYKFHPHQYVYFNIIFKNKFHDNFDKDYWGISNRESLEYIINNNFDYPIKIGTKSFASLEMTSLMLKEEDKSKISIIHNLKEADYVVTNYRTLIKRNFIIDNDKYKKYYEVVVDNTPINTVYKKIN